MIIYTLNYKSLGQMKPGPKARIVLLTGLTLDVPVVKNAAPELWGWYGNIRGWKSVIHSFSKVHHTVDWFYFSVGFRIKHRHLTHTHTPGRQQAKWKQRKCCVLTHILAHRCVLAVSGLRPACLFYHSSPQKCFSSSFPWGKQNSWPVTFFADCTDHPLSW